MPGVSFLCPYLSSSTGPIQLPCWEYPVLRIGDTPTFRIIRRKVRIQLQVGLEALSNLLT